MDKNIILCYREEYTRDNRIRYVADIMHLKYSEHKIIKDYSREIVQSKVDSLIMKWEQMNHNENMADYAHEQTIEIKELNCKIENVLLDGLIQEVDVISQYEKELGGNLSKINESIQTLNSYLAKLCKPQKPTENVLQKYPDEPLEKDFIPTYGLIHKLLPFLKKRADSKKKREYEIARQEYKKICLKIDEHNYYETDIYKRSLKIYTEKSAAYESNYAEITTSIQKEEANLQNEKTIIQTKLNEIKEQLSKGFQNTVEKYCFDLLTNSEYCLEWEKNIVVSFNERLLAIDYSLPSIDNFPSLAEVKYKAGECIPIKMSDKVFESRYENTLYKITLRSLHELFSDKYLTIIDSVVFNGWVTALNKTNGKIENNCILSIKTNRQQIAEIDFLNVNPKSCFKALKGIACSNLASISAIKPILMLNTSDKRFIEYYNVSEGMDNSTNLASMHWEDFEHLIRELFEKEFSQSGGEVKVTRASRDGGVDAIVFDPDPIRGGKIVIQAKRYTNTVGVSAVRDLYGTVLNEGASKGIIVTTSDYGGDSYEFAKDKPLTLINGANLLYMLEKHGQHARIDISEAKQTLNNESNI